MSLKLVNWRSIASLKATYVEHSVYFDTLLSGYSLNEVSHKFMANSSLTIPSLTNLESKALMSCHLDNNNALLFNKILDSLLKFGSVLIVKESAPA
jgi:hypothetical protein